MCPQGHRKLPRAEEIMTGARQYSPGNVNKRWVKPAPVAGRERPLLSRGAGQEARTASTWLGALSTCVLGGLAKSRRWKNGGVRAGAAAATEERGPLSARPPPRRTAGRGPQALGSARSPLPGWRTSAGAGEARPQAAAPPLARSLALPLRRRRGDSAELSECALGRRTERPGGRRSRSGPARNARLAGS